jgi:hypothetical protein
MMSTQQRTGRMLFKGGSVVTMDPKVSHLALVDGGRIAAIDQNLSAEGAELSTPLAASSCRASSMPATPSGSASPARRGSAAR